MARINKAVAAHFLAAFEGNLKRLGIDAANDASCDIADISVWDGDGSIKMKDLPRAIPEAMRKRIVALSDQHVTIGNQIIQMLSAFESVAERVVDELDAAEEKAKPHCKECGHVIVPKAKKRK